ncbi:protein-histidine kinase [Gigaspora margarita]|uniref:Protein-histidine kinase n=1 Tax=Gigaspora margarita TaxID=4874 RepID=A0A8H3X3M6_GIGMA|nr:protein-histidine kinase [Gigaspora margarita]
MTNNSVNNNENSSLLERFYNYDWSSTSLGQIIMKALQNNQDIPYALIYLIENNKDSKIGFNTLVARLVATTFDEICKEEFIHEKLKRHIPDYFPETNEIIDLTRISDQDYGTYVEVKYATSTHSFLRCDCWPINLVMKEEKYIQSVLNYVNRILIRGMSIEEEKRRAKILADLNHQKDMFFQSISHELKTPLTLIFSPLDE